MRLHQGQVWKCGGDYVRVVQLERMEVGYKLADNLKFTDGKHLRASKKDFCRLLKGAELVTPDPTSAVPVLPA